MAPRRRKEINRSLPDYMRLRDGYYSWRHPETKIEYGLGADRRKAIQEGIRANAQLKTQEPSLVDRIKVDTGRTWGAWIEKYTPILLGKSRKTGKPLADNSVSAYKRLLRLAASVIDKDKQADQIDTADIANALDPIVQAGKARTAQTLRSHLEESFRTMIAKGWRKDNPVTVTDSVVVVVKRARLQLDVFLRIHEAETKAWAKNAYMLALVSGQALEECSGAEFKHVHDGALWVDRGKTGARIVLPLDLRIDCVGMSLGDVVRQCRSTGVLSRFLIHQTHNWKNSPKGASISLDTISGQFRATLRSLEIDWGEKEPPSYHEIRSLSGRLYKQEGKVNPQELYGHTDPKTTKIYTDERDGERREWVKVGIKN